MQDIDKNERANDEDNENNPRFCFLLLFLFAHLIVYKIGNLFF